MTDYQFTFNGYTFGGGSNAVQILGVQGLEDTPPVRTSDQDRGFADGSFYGRDFLTGRTVSIDLQFLNTGTQSFRQVVEDAKAALLPQGGASTVAAPLTFTLPGIAPRRVYCRLRRRALPITQDYTFGKATGAVEFYAGDPRIYDDAASALSVGLSGASGGLTFNATFNITFGTTAAPNTQVAINAGTYPTAPVITITGPVDTPVIQHVESSRTLKLNIVVAAGDTLTLDADTRSVMLNGTASRRSSLSTDSRWWDLAPGTNTIKFTAAAATTATATLSWRNAYL